MAVTIEKMNKINKAVERAVELYRKGGPYESGSGSGEAIGIADAEFLNCPRDFDVAFVRFYRAIGRR